MKETAKIYWVCECGNANKFETSILIVLTSEKSEQFIGTSECVKCRKYREIYLELKMSQGFVPLNAISEECIPDGTKVIEKETGEERVIAFSIPQDNRFNQGLYLYTFEDTPLGFGLYRNEFDIVQNDEKIETNENIRTMEYVGVDDWGKPIYKCIETGVLYKDMTLGSNNPELYSCGNEFDGDPCSPINSDLTIIFKTKYEENPHRFNYMMLDRLRSDCDYYLGYGNRNKSRLCDGSVKNHIDKMKELHNSFPEGQKPEWLTYEGILEYEKQMSEFDIIKEGDS